jgi:signal transduction histidine kinase
MSPKGEVLSRVLQGETNGVVRSVSSLDNQARVILFRKLGDYPAYIGVGREMRAIDTEWLWELATIAGFAVLPVLGIVYAAYLALKRTREALEAARQLQQESSARRQAEEALVQSQKLEALGRLTGGVAHDFNNALMVISGNLHLLKLSHPGLPSRYADAISRAIESATKLTRQLLAFSRRQALSPETIRLQDYLPAVRDLLSPTLGGKVQLQIDVARDAHPIHVDPADLELGLINLAVNARDAMPNGGQFRLVARDVRAADGRLLVAVEAIDTGDGMDPATLAKAFDPFFTTKPIGKGTGLGLSQVHALCKRAKGDVELESEKGRGTTVRLLFPASDQSGREDLQRDEGRARFDRRVLLVEDNPEVAAVVLPALEALGCDVKHLESADAAAQWLDAHPDKVDLLLTDVVMPGERDGISLVAHVQARHPALRIVIMTGYAEQIEAVSGLGFQVLPKPFSPRSLAEALEKALG